MAFRSTGEEERKVAPRSFQLRFGAGILAGLRLDLYTSNLWQLTRTALSATKCISEPYLKLLC